MQERRETRAQNIAVARAHVTTYRIGERIRKLQPRLSRSGFVRASALRGVLFAAKGLRTAVRYNDTMEANERVIYCIIHQLFPTTMSLHVATPPEAFNVHSNADPINLGRSNDKSLIPGTFHDWSRTLAGHNPSNDRPPKHNTK